MLFPAGAVVLALVAVAGLGFGNQYVFNQKTASLHATWQQERAAGVSKAELAPLQAQLNTMEQRSVGPVPYPYYSMSLFHDPLTTLEAQSGKVYQQALTKTRHEARSDLTALQADYGPTPFDLAAHQQQLSKATTPAGYLKLVKAWTVEGAQVTASRDALSKAAGGLTDGLPTDIVNDKTRLEQQAQQLTKAKLWTDPEPAADTAVQTYLKQSYATMLQQHTSMANQLSSASQTLTARIELDTKAQTLESSIPSMIQQWGSGTNDQQQFQQAEQAVSAATNDQQLSSATGTLQSLFNSLSAAQQKAEAATQAAAQSAGIGATACLPNKATAPAQEIVVNEVAETMVAYQNGCPWISSYVTTGRPGLRTDVGTFHIFAKYPTYTMVSPWPPSSPYWYPTTVVPMAMEFVDDGTFLHGAPWEPDADMGPGSENNLAIASHGCVHIPSTVLPKLYNWAQIGATVIVTT